MRPNFIVLCGAPFSGKSSLAKQLAEGLSIKVVSYDNDIYAKYKHTVPQGTTPAKEFDMIELKAREHLGDLLRNNESVIYDDLCLERSDRLKLEQLAQDTNARYILVFLDTPLEVIQQRRDANMQNTNRDHISDEKLQLDLSLLQKPGADENPILVRPETQLHEVLAAIRSALAQ